MFNVDMKFSSRRTPGVTNDCCIFLFLFFKLRFMLNLVFKKSNCMSQSAYPEEPCHDGQVCNQQICY